MLRLGMVGGVELFHGPAFASIVNGKDEAAWKEAGMWEAGVGPFEDARFAAIWDPDWSKAEGLARLCRIQKVTDSPEEMLSLVDAVVIPDDGTEQHQKRARMFLERGVPTFIDKPLSRDPAEASDIIACARDNGALMMSSSALRYARELEEARPQIEQIGEIRTGCAIGPNELIYYGIHPCELFFTVMGPGVEYVHNVGHERGDVVLVAYRDGRRMVLQVFRDIGYVFHLSLYGANGWVQFSVGDAGYFYSNMLRHFVEMVKTGVEAIPLEHTLEIIKILACAEKSLKTGQRVYL